MVDSPCRIYINEKDCDTVIKLMHKMELFVIKGERKRNPDGEEDLLRFVKGEGRNDFHSFYNQLMTLSAPHPPQAIIEL
jgi:hypothetical protein